MRINPRFETFKKALLSLERENLVSISWKYKDRIVGGGKVSLTDSGIEKAKPLLKDLF